jgi:hypothetical protein
MPFTFPSRGTHLRYREVPTVSCPPASCVRRSSRPGRWPLVFALLAMPAEQGLFIELEFLGTGARMGVASAGRHVLIKDAGQAPRPAQLLRGSRRLVMQPTTRSLGLSCAAYGDATSRGPRGPARTPKTARLACVRLWSCDDTTMSVGPAIGPRAAIACHLASPASAFSARAGAARESGRCRPRQWPLTERSAARLVCGGGPAAQPSLDS